MEIDIIMFVIYKQNEIECFCGFLFKLSFNENRLNVHSILITFALIRVIIYQLASLLEVHTLVLIWTTPTYLA